MRNSAIEWTDATWNPVRGCARVSEGCRNCYAERMAARFSNPGLPFHRLAAMTPSGPRWTNEIQLVETVLHQPLRWRKPQNVFVNSMSDLFHEDVPVSWILRVFDVMRRADRHRYQILTKRAARLEQLDRELPWAPHIFMGVSVENTDNLYRINYLRSTHAATKFLSLEPLLGPLNDLNLTGIDWVIVGGESGPGARSMDPAWVRDIREQCLATNTPFFFKQWGKLVNNPNCKDTTAKKNGGTAKGGRLLDSRTWDEMPRGESP